MNEEIDVLLEATAGLVISSDTVAIWNDDYQIYGIYCKVGEDFWKLKMTALNIQPLMETK